MAPMQPTAAVYLCIDTGRAVDACVAELLHRLAIGATT